MNKEKIAELEKKIQNDYSNIAGIMILKDGKELYENYFSLYNNYFDLYKSYLICK